MAEHLEVAEVLMEAGGLSVTKIMEVAATKIQALARGYIIRINRQRMKLWIHPTGEVLYSINKLQGKNKLLYMERMIMILFSFTSHMKDNFPITLYHEKTKEYA